MGLRMVVTALENSSGWGTPPRAAFGERALPLQGRWGGPGTERTPALYLGMQLPQQLAGRGRQRGSGQP